MNDNKDFQDFLRENPIPTECFTAREQEVVKLYAYSAFLTAEIKAIEKTQKLYTGFPFHLVPLTGAL